MVGPVNLFGFPFWGALQVDVTMNGEFCPNFCVVHSSQQPKKRRQAIWLTGSRLAAKTWLRSALNGTRGGRKEKVLTEEEGWKLGDQRPETTQGKLESLHHKVPKMEGAGR